MLTPQEEQALQEAEWVQELSLTKGYREVLKPYLLDKLNQSFPDPSQFTKEEEFTYAAKTTSVFKKVIVELLGYVEGQTNAVKVLREKKDGKTVDTFSFKE